MPGLGHLLIGERVRGLIILVAITLTFWGGVAIGGVHDTVYPRARKAWFMGQVCTGGHALAAHAWGESVRGQPGSYPGMKGHWQSVETGVVYTGVAGLLNLLAIIDALSRADLAEPRRRPGGAGAATRNTA